MACAFTTLIMTGIVVVFLFAGLPRKRWEYALQRNLPLYLDNLLASHGGTMEKISEDAYRIEFPYWTGTVTARTRKVRVELEAPDFRFERFVFPEVEVGDNPERFEESATRIVVHDRSNAVTDYPEDRARLFLDEQTLKTLTNLVRITYDRGGKFKLKDKTLTLVKTGRLLQLQTVVHIVRIALRLASRAVAALGITEGVEVLTERGMPSDEKICQICACPLDLELVACAKCSTPHHKECWHYAGVCSTYGCGERRNAPIPNP